MNISKYVIGIVVFFLPGLMQGVNAQEADVKQATAVEFKEFIEKGLGQLIDIRTQSEYDMGHIAGAAMIDFYSSTFQDKLNKLNKDKPIYIYCRSGNRSSHSLAILKQLGFKEIVNLQRGLVDWNNNGFELVKG